MLKVWLAKGMKEALEVVSSDSNWVTVETEYGEKTLDTSYNGVELSLNHHGELQNSLAPAETYKLNIKKRYDNFIISHVDIDTLFGILWSAGFLKKTKVTIALSNIIAEADKNGFHSIDKKLKRYPKAIVDRYLAIGYLINSWVINDNGLLKKDISKEIHKLILRIKDIIMNGATEKQIAEYKLWLSNQKVLAKKHLLSIIDLCNNEKLFVYRAPFRLTSAYQLENINGSIILQYNEQSKSITLSCKDEDIAQTYFGKKGVIEPLQLFFGELAGGKKAIGGSPRNTSLQPELLNAFLIFLKREYFNIPRTTDLNLTD